jgi:hypothetical protein
LEWKKYFPSEARIESVNTNEANFSLLNFKIPPQYNRTNVNTENATHVSKAPLNFFPLLIIKSTSQRFTLFVSQRLTYPASHLLEKN